MSDRSASRALFLLFSAFLLLALTTAPAVAQTWLRDYEIGGRIAVDDDGSVVLVGNRSATFSPGRQLVVTRLAPSGVILSSNVIGYDRDDREKSVVFLNDGAIAIGNSHRLEGGHDSPSDPNLSVIVLEPDLTLRWQSMLIASSFDYEPKVLPRPDGGLVLMGDADPDLDGNQDVWLTRFDATGQVVWQRAWGSNVVSERPSGIVGTPGGGFAVSGFQDEGLGDVNMLLARFNDDGDLLWARKYGVFGASTFDRGRAVAAAPDGSLYLAGETDSFGGVAGDWLVVKTDASGAVVWARRMDGARNAQSASDVLRDAVADADGVVLLGGRPQDSSLHDPWAMRLDNDGNYVWSRGWPDADNVEGLEVRHTPEGGYLFSAQGSALGTGVGRLIRTDANALLQSGCDPGGYNGVLPQAATVASAGLSWDSLATNIAPSAEPWFENDEVYAIQSSCIGPPGEVSRPGAASPLRFETSALLVWEEGSLSNSDTFDLYRGDLADLAGGGSPDCLEPNLVLPEATDTDVPTNGAGFGYMVGGRNSAGVGSLGSTSNGVPRPNDQACP